MAELAASAFAAMSAAAPAAAGAAASATAAAATGTAAAGAGTAVAAGSGLLSGLQGVATIASMVSALYGGAAAYRSGKNQEMFMSLDAENSRIEGESQSLAIRRELVKRIGDARVAVASSGLDISSASEVEAGLVSQADFEIANVRGGSSMARAGRLAQAAAAGSRGTAEAVTSIARAGQYGIDYALDLRKRG